MPEVVLEEDEIEEEGEEGNDDDEDEKTGDDELEDELALEPVLDTGGGPLLYWNRERRLEPPQISFVLPLQAILQPALPSGAGPPPFSSLLSQ